MKSKDAAYLGDSVYIDFANGMIVLTTENGEPTGPSNTIYLEPSVYENLVRVVEARKTQHGGF